jgi:TPR repeat protein
LKKSFELYLKAAEKGDIDAMYYVGCDYDKGLVVKKDGAKAVEWFLKAVNKGDVEAMNYLGFMYEKGNGVDKNMERRWKCILWPQKKEMHKPNLI